MKAIQIKFALLVLLFVGTALPAAASSLEKARTLRANGLLEDAKKEAIDVAFFPSSADAEKAEAFLLLGDIAVDEKNFEAARENWSKVVALVPDTEQSNLAKQKTDLLEQLVKADASEPPEVITFAPGTVVVLPDPSYDWSGVEISAALGSTARSHTATLPEAVELAASNPNIAGIAQVRLDTSSLFETGHVVCYDATGRRLWEVSVFYNTGGSEEKIARRFVRNLTKKLKGKKCVSPRSPSAGKQP